MTTPYYLEIAASMLDLDNIDDIPASLAKKLASIDKLVKKFWRGKELASSQIIAYIVYEWMENERLIDELLEK